jgi:hypothetical protein
VLPRDIRYWCWCGPIEAGYRNRKPIENAYRAGR